ncbi:MAG: hypothetical protein M3Q19_00495 [Pseudomonadota bacterium]|nr:hypothetical protein [Pseudomonadota bacterium]
MMNRWGGIALLLGSYFFVPVFVAKVPMGASWRCIFIAYGIWVALLTVFGLTSTKTWGEAAVWPLIVGMFFTIPFIVITVFFLNVAGVR